MIHFTSLCCYLAVGYANLCNTPVVDFPQSSTYKLNEPFISVSHELLSLSCGFHGHCGLSFHTQQPLLFSLVVFALYGYLFSTGSHPQTNTRICGTMCSTGSFSFLPSESTYVFWRCPPQDPRSEKLSTTVSVHTSHRASDKISSSTNSFSVTSST